MSQHKRKITIRVTTQTAYHIKCMAQIAGITPGQIVDNLVLAIELDSRKGGSLCLSFDVSASKKRTPL